MPWYSVEAFLSNVKIHQAGASVLPKVKTIWSITTESWVWPSRKVKHVDKENEVESEGEFRSLCKERKVGSCDGLGIFRLSWD